MKFCKILSLILVIAKIFGLITLGWWSCLAPFIVAELFKALGVLLVIMCLAGADIKEEEE